ncbi:MAG: Ig-like domain-containing protein [Bacteroidales bacterium]|nr:Ig-like domain-containing protein [Bacteroidales bacterium]
MSVTPKTISVTGVAIEPSTLEIKEGATFQLKATVSPADASQAVDWASPSPHIATVDQNGLLTAVAPGTVRIVVRSKAFTDKQGFCDVTVTQDNTLTGISLDVDEITIAAGDSRNLTVIFYPEYASNKNVTWKSSDASVVTVSDGKVFGLKEGTATVTATSEEGSFTAECVVIVGKAEGPLIYSIGSDRSVYVNGELDPRSGIFNTDSFRLYTSEYIEAEGKDLITYEVYTNKSGDEPWICKNREPIISLAGHEGQTVYGLSCRNGVYAVLYINRDGEKKVVKAKSDGTVTEYELKGVAISMSSVTTTVAPSGDIYVSASIRDNFNQYYLAMYKLSDDGKVTEKLIEKNSIARPTIGVTDAGDVYILAGNYDEGMESVRLYKNGEFYKTIDQVEVNLESSLRCVGNDVYTVIKDEVNKQVRVHKNGTKYQTLDYSQEVYLHYATGDQRPFWVNGSGDVYLSLLENGSLYRIYKNGKNLYSTDNSGTVSFQPFCVIE